MADRAEVVIVGGGVIGTSVAFHLARLGVTDVLLLERAHIAAGSTGRSVGIVEASYAADVNVALAKRGVDELSRFHEVTGHSADFVPRAYVESVSNPAHGSHVEAVLGAGRRHGVRIDPIGPEDLHDLFPELRTDDLVAACVEPGAGFCDPQAVAHGYASAAQRLGARVRTNAPVGKILVDRGEVTGVSVGAETVRAPTVVNAAGPWCNDVNRSVGFELPVRLWQRQIFVTTPHPEIPADRPMYVDVSARFYFRQELAGGFVLGLVEDVAATELAAPETDWDFKAKAVAAAVHRVPKLSETGIASAWSGIVTFTPDQLPVLGPVQEARGLYLANGMSGYGVMISPGVGLAIAEMIALGESKSIDVSALGIERFRRPGRASGAGLWPHAS
ncbi:MAG TPA: FAD-binding oxidoreductase [Thermoplasmata archaeon]|nr:FAD-binding oxidoreductase [Thermoplasmata archaeon]